MAQDFAKIKKVKDDNLMSLLQKPNVAGVGIGYKIEENKPTNELCIRIYVEEKKNESQLKKAEMVPEKLGGIKTDVIVVGRIRFQQCDQKTRKRPFSGGDSGGSCHSVAYGYIMAGTLGCKVVDKSDGKYCVLSNNHVLADMDNDGQTRAHVGDATVQPGTLDGGTCVGDADRIGNLKRWIPFLVHGDNRVDAAISELINQSDMNTSIGCDVGNVTGIRTLTSDDIDTLTVQKCGRTTCHTQGTVTDIDATVNVNYEVLGPSGVVTQTFRFVHQIITTSMSSSGDSGSLIMDMDRKAVGLLFAGSDVVTIANPIQNVLDDLNVEFPKSVVSCITGGPLHCKTGGPDFTCIKGGPGFSCATGGPIYTCIPSGPFHCRFGGPDMQVYVCKSGGPWKLKCLACGPDSILPCGSGGPDNLIDVFACASGPDIDFRFRIPFEDPSKLVVLDITAVPPSLKKAFMKMLEDIARYK